MNAEIQNMIGVLIHVAKSDEFLDHEEKNVLKNIIYRYSIDSDDLVKIKNTQENLSEKLLKVKIIFHFKNQDIFDGYRFPGCGDFGSVGHWQFAVIGSCPGTFLNERIS